MFYFMVYNLQLDSGTSQYHTINSSLFRKILNLYGAVVTCRRIYARPTEEGGPYAWIKIGSFFWNAIARLKDFCHWCTFWIIGRGDTISFWFDSWCGAPIISHSDTRPTQQVLSLRDAQPILLEVAPTCNLVFTDQSDRIQWKWNENGTYCQDFWISDVKRQIADAGCSNWKRSALRDRVRHVPQWKR